jgi:hypothetical protein
MVTGGRTKVLLGALIIFAFEPSLIAFSPTGKAFRQSRHLRACRLFVAGGRDAPRTSSSENPNHDRHRRCPLCISCKLVFGWHYLAMMQDAGFL